MRFETLAQELAERGWTVVEDFVAPEAVTALRREAAEFVEAQRFRDAGVGRADAHQVRTNVRSDRICWLDAEALTPAQSVYWEAAESLRSALNRELFLSLASFEAHYAIYDPGTFYSKHVDRFKSSDERMISSSLYLNPDWVEADGGQLRLYDDAGHTDILPRAGVCVLFRSDTVPHEVLPATRPRFSLTGWFRRRPLLPF
jgi:SM-20-related protein